MGYLVGAGGGLHAALDALETVDDLLVRLTLDERTDALEIAMATAEDFSGYDAAAFASDTDEFTAGALSGVVDNFHNV